MAIKTYRPVTPTLRFQTTLVNDDLTTDKPHKPLLVVCKRTGGRRNSGDMTIRHQGGGHKKKLRLIDFKRDKYGVPGKVATIEYDPGRSARIALVNYADGEKRYILQPVGLKVGATVTSGPDADILIGNALPLKSIPSGTTVHAIELRPGKGAQMARSAGTQAQLVAKEGEYALLKLPSGETRKVLAECMATIGQVSTGAETVFRHGTVARHLDTLFGVSLPAALDQLTTEAVAQAAREKTGATHALAVLIELDDGADRIDFGGTIWIGIATAERVEFRRSRILGGRDWVRLGAVELGLDCLRRFLLGLPVVERIDFEKT